MSDKHSAGSSSADESAAIKQQMSEIADGVSNASHLDSIPTDKLFDMLTKKTLLKNELSAEISAVKKTIQKRVGAM